MPTYRFKQVDVFTERPLFGNPVAVVLDADGIDEAGMQRIAAWTNLSETTFFQTPSTDEADYRLRIFAPTHELPFAGHPTIGSAHAALEGGVTQAKSSLVQECGAGLLPLRLEGDGPERRIFVRVPEPRVARECGDMVDSISASLGTPILTASPPIAIDVGPIWLVVPVEDVGAIDPDVGALIKLSRQLGGVGVTAFSLGGEDGCAIRVRSLAPDAGIFEDPVCGSGNATVGAYLALTGMLADVGDTYVASQGREMGRDGRVHVSVADDGRIIEIGGHAVTVVEGEVRL